MKVRCNLDLFVCAVFYIQSCATSKQQKVRW